LRIFVSGSDQIFAIENFYVKYLREQGEEVFHFPAQRIFIDYYKSSLLNRVLFRLGLSAINQKINAQFLKSFHEFKPEIVWVFKGMELSPKSLEQVRKSGVKLVNYNPDNPFLFSGRGSGNTNITSSLGLYHLHFTYNRSVKEQLERVYPTRTALLPFGFDIDEALFEDCVRQAEICETCFLGNPDRGRANFIQTLADQGVSITVYGNGWSKFLSHPLITICNPVLGDELWKVLRKYRVQLNLMRMHNEDSHNMRTFEVPGIGGIMVAPDTPDHRLFFDDGNEIFLFKDAYECADKIKMLLSLSSEKANEIRAAARIRSLSSNYSYQDRAVQALAELKKL